MAAAQGIRAGRAFVELGTDNNPFVAGLKAAERHLKQFGANITAIGAPMAAAGTAIVAPLLASAKVFASAGDTLDKMSARTGVSVEALSALGFAAEQTGTDLETLEKGFAGLSRTFFEAKRGGQEAIDALAEIGLTFEQLEGKSPDDQFVLIADRLERITDESIRGAVAQKIFGRAGRQLLPMLRGAKGGIEELTKQARDLGLVISSETAADAAKFNDSMNILARVLKQGVFTVGSALAPVLTEFSARIANIVVRANEWIRQNGEVIVTVLKVAAAVAAAGGHSVAHGDPRSAAETLDRAKN